MQKAKNIVLDSSVGRSSDGMVDSTTTTKHAKSQRRGESSSNKGGNKGRDGAKIRDTADTNTISIKTVGSGLKQAFAKSKGRFVDAMEGGLRLVTRNTWRANGDADSMRSSLDTMDCNHTTTLDDADGDNCATSGDGGNVKVIKIVVTPTIAILLHDVTVALTLLALLAAVPTWHNWNSIVKNQLPSSVICVWIIVAFCAGIEIGRVKGMRSVSGKKKTKGSEGISPLHTLSSIRSAGTTVARTDASVSFTPPASVSFSPPSEVLVVRHESITETDPVHEGYALIYTLLSPFAHVKLLFAEDATTLVAKQIDSVAEAPTMFWSTLTHQTREAWETVGFVKVADPLMQRLLKNSDYARKPLKDVVAVQDGDGNGPDDRAGDDSTCGKIGAFDISRYDASTLENDVVAPCMTLRGMDIFLTDDPEDNLSSHPFLLKQGLRKKPTVLVNIIVQWANILVYFQLPDWFTDFDDIFEADDDANDVRAMKVSAFLRVALNKNLMYR